MSPNLRQEEQKSIATRLRNNREEIIALWRNRAKAELPAARGQKTSDLIDHLPKMLDKLAESLGSDFPKLQESAQVAEEHAEQRAALETFPLEQVLLEYRILRQVLFEVLEPDHLLTSHERNVILDFLQQALTSAAVRFATLHIDAERSINERLHRLAEREAALAELGGFALQTLDVDAVMERALSQLTRILDVEYAKVLELLPGKNVLRLRAGVGWKPGSVGVAEIPLGNDSEGGYTIAARKPVIAKDLSQEKRFQTDWFLEEHSVLSGMTVIIEGDSGPFGVLGVHSKTQRDFSRDDIHFLQSTANILASAIQTQRQVLRFRALADAVPALVWERESKGDAVYLNLRWQEYTGKCLEENLGIGWFSNIHPDDQERVKKAWEQADVSGQPYESEIRLRRADGEYQWHLGRGIPIKAPTGRILRWIGTTVNIDEQRRALEELRLERDLREQFVSTLTHDLRSPLAAAQMSTYLLSRKLDQPEAFPGILGRVSDNLARADRMIQDLLDASRIRAGQPLPIHIAPTDLKIVATQVLDNMTSIHGNRFFLKGADVPVTGEWDAKAIQRVIENLVQNAVKYGSPNAPITVTLRDDEKHAVLCVHNEGNPLSPAEIAILFQPFRRTETADRSEKRGWGLGLTLVKGVLDAHHGRIEVDSSLENGTTFTIILPKRL